MQLHGQAARPAPVADITCIPTGAVFIYLAVVLDVWSQGVLGWSIGEDMRTELVLVALNMALATRKLENQGRAPSGGLYMDRILVQPTPPPLDP